MGWQPCKAIQIWGAQLRLGFDHGLLLTERTARPRVAINNEHGLLK